MTAEQDDHPAMWTAHPDCAGFCGGDRTPETCWAFACIQRLRGQHITQRDGAKGDGKGDFDENPIPVRHTTEHNTPCAA